MDTCIKYLTYGGTNIIPMISYPWIPNNILPMESCLTIDISPMESYDKVPVEIFVILPIDTCDILTMETYDILPMEICFEEPKKK